MTFDKEPLGKLQLDKLQLDKKKAATLSVIAGAVLVVPFLFFGSTPANAITAGDVMDKLDGDERTGFLGGAVEMAATFYQRSQNSKKAECALNWYFRTDNGLRETFSFFDAYPDKNAVGLISILIDRRCGK